MEHTFGRILDARDVHRHQILGHLLPFHGSGTAGGHVKHFRPQPEHTDKSENTVMLYKQKWDTEFDTTPCFTVKHKRCGGGCGNVLAEKKQQKLEVCNT